MAHRHDKERFCTVSLVETDRSFTRRIHRLTVQDRHGRTYTLVGNSLPNVISIDTSEQRKGNHLGQIILNPKHVSPFPIPDSRPWPCGRDAINIVIGFVLISMIRFFVSAVEIGLTSAY